MAQLKYKKNGTYVGIGPDVMVELHQMPQVSSLDNGRFARVVDGQWAAVSIPQAEDINNYDAHEQYLALGSSLSQLNAAVNAKCGTSGFHTLTQMIALLEA